MTMKEQSDRVVDEVKESMIDMSLDELMLWHKHVLFNPYKSKDGVSEKILEVLGVEIVKRGGKVR